MHLISPQLPRRSMLPNLLTVDDSQCLLWSCHNSPKRRFQRIHFLLWTIRRSDAASGLGFCTRVCGGILLLMPLLNGSTDQDVQHERHDQKSENKEPDHAPNDTADQGGCRWSIICGSAESVKRVLGSRCRVYMASYARCCVDLVR